MKLLVITVLFACLIALAFSKGSSGGGSSGSGGGRGGSGGGSSGSSGGRGGSSSSSSSSGGRGSSSSSASSSSGGRGGSSSSSAGRGSSGSSASSSSSGRGSGSSSTSGKSSASSGSKGQNAKSSSSSAAGQGSKTSSSKSMGSKQAQTNGGKQAPAKASLSGRQAADSKQTTGKQTPGKQTPGKQAPVGKVAKQTVVGVDHGFIAKMEGVKAKAYVPTKNHQVIGISGVTIANGLDMGQRKNFADLTAAGMSPAIASKLSGFLGLKGKEALAAVQANPVTLSKAEVANVAAAVSKAYDAKIAKTFDALGGPKFSAMPPAAQTAFASVSHQYGENSGKKNSRVNGIAKAMKAGDFAAAAKGLEGMAQTPKGKQYANRRSQEAAVMRSATY